MISLPDNRTHVNVPLACLVFTMLACTNADTPPADVAASDHAELAAMYAADQSERTSAKTMEDFERLTQQDGVRRDRVRVLMSSLASPTANDLYHAAMVYQHGNDSSSYKQAFDWSKRAVELDSTHTKARWLTAASWDRYLMSKGEPQWYGTQFRRRDHTGPWELYQVDTTRVTDAERIRAGVKPLAEQRLRAKTLNEEDKMLIMHHGKDSLVHR